MLATLLFVLGTFGQEAANKKDGWIVPAGTLVFSSARVDSEVIASLVRGAMVQVNVSTKLGNFYHIEFGDSGRQTGWLLAEDVTFVDPAKVSLIPYIAPETKQSVRESVWRYIGQSASPIRDIYSRLFT